MQVPVEKSLRDSALKVVREMGFSSLQENIRVYLKQLSQKRLDLTLTQKKVVHLSPKAAARYDKLMEDIESGKEPVYTAESAEDLIQQLDGDKNPVLKKVS